MNFRLAHVCLRGRFYHFRQTIPARLRARLGCREFLWSLRTTSLAHAQEVSRAASELACRLLKAAEQGELHMPVHDDTPVFVKAVTERFGQCLVRALATRVLSGGPLTAATAETLAGEIREAEQQAGSQFSKEAFGEIDALLCQFVGDQFDLQSLFPQRTASRVWLCREALKARLVILGQVREWLRGGVAWPFPDVAPAPAAPPKTANPVPVTMQPATPVSPPTPVPPQPAPALVTAAGGILLSRAIKDYCKEHVDSGAWSGRSTIQEYEVALDLLLDQLGDKPLSAFTHPMLLDFRDRVLMRLPSNREKRKAYREKTVPELLAMVIPDEDRMQLNTVNKYMRRINGLFNWALNHEHIVRNPAHSLQLSRRRQAHEERSAFSQDDLAAMWKALATVPAKHPWRYWTPLVALFSGMRQNEIGQLMLKDVVQRDGVPCFDVNAEGQDKKLKSLSARRLIPIHPALVELGFLDYVAVVNRMKAAQLWPDLEYRRDGYGQEVSRWFATWKKTWLPAPASSLKKDFHSFRHTFANGLKQADVEDVKLYQLMGHSIEKNLSLGRYGKPFEPKALLAAVQKLDFKLAPAKIKRPWSRVTIREARRKA